MAAVCRWQTDAWFVLREVLAECEPEESGPGHQHPAEPRRLLCLPSGSPGSWGRRGEGGKDPDTTA